MAIGRLQDNPKLGILATIDIDGNPISRASPDRYASVRPYWEKITDRKPIALPFYAGLPDPCFSQDAGFYETGFELILSSDDPAADIFFTLDGTEPTLSSAKYKSPLLIESPAGQPNVLSAIETIAANWEKPENEVTKAVVVRARAIDRRTGDSSAVVTHTYFVGADIKQRYSLPIVSLATDPKNFFDEAIGIYVNGRPYRERLRLDITEDERQKFANYNQHGRDWERPISFELFEDEGNLYLGQNIGVRIHGGGSRRSPQKTLRFYSRPEYDVDDLITYPLFGVQAADNQSQPPHPYQSFLLRNSGQDWMRASFRDNFVQTLARESQLDTQAGRPVVVFLNGEYWGIYTLQERYDEYYLARRYGIAPQDAVILRQGGVLFRGAAGDENHYQGMLSYIRKNGLSDPRHYAAIQTMLDVDNYIDYLIAEIFAGNDDWPDNNIYLWRAKTDQYLPDAPYGQDGRWRWMLFDMDFGFGLQGGLDDIHENTVKVAQQAGWGGFLFRALLENDAFKQAFINHFADQMNTTFNPGIVTVTLDRMRAELQPEMEEYIQRWSANSFSANEWEAEVGVMRAFALGRPDAVRSHIVKEFGLAGTANLKVWADLEKGSVQVNSVEITPGLPGTDPLTGWEGVYFKGVPITITAAPQPGYKFLGWAGSASKANVLTLSLQEDLELTALFGVE